MAFYNPPHILPHSSSLFPKTERPLFTPKQSEDSKEGDHRTHQLVKNRKSAQASRKRKKEKVSNLQATCSDLQAKNQKLREIARGAEKQLDTLQEESNYLKSLIHSHPLLLELYSRSDAIKKSANSVEQNSRMLSFYQACISLYQTQYIQQLQQPQQQYTQQLQQPQPQPQPQYIQQLQQPQPLLVPQLDSYSTPIFQEQSPLSCNDSNLIYMDCDNQNMTTPPTMQDDSPMNLSCPLHNSCSRESSNDFAGANDSQNLFDYDADDPEVSAFCASLLNSSSDLLPSPSFVYDSNPIMMACQLCY